MTVVKLLSALLAIIGIKVVSVSFSIEEYGTYGQASLIISTVTSFTILGMTDGVNYTFNNTTLDSEKRSKGISTLFALQTFVGTAGGVAILLGGSSLSDYFKNPALGAVYIWIAFQPLLSNYLPMLQNLYISIGKTKLIVLRNLFLSIFRLGVFLWASYVSKSILTILAACFLFDLAQTVYFWLLLRRYNVRISFAQIDISQIKPLLRFCIPMAVFVILNALLRDIDKWIVGYLGNTDQVAIYTNCSRVLPFDMLTASFATVLIPVITRNIIINKPRVMYIFNLYLNLCVLTTGILILPAILFSKDLLLTLYASDYLPGLNIFIVYLLVDLLRFANISIIFSATGRSSQLMVIALTSLIFNTILAIFLYKLMGFSGPAYATLLTMFLSTSVLFWGGGRILDANLAKVIDYKAVGIMVAEIALLGTVAYGLQSMMPLKNPIIQFFIFYLPLVGVVSLLNRKPIFNYLRAINEIR